MCWFKQLLGFLRKPEVSFDITKEDLEESRDYYISLLKEQESGMNRTLKKKELIEGAIKDLQDRIDNYS